MVCLYTNAHFGVLNSSMTMAIFFGLFAIGCLYCEFFFPGGLFAIFSAGFFAVGVALCILLHKGWVWNCAYFVGLIALACVACKGALWQIARSARKNYFYLSSDQSGFLASEYPIDLIGEKGIAKCDLKPSGYAYIAKRSVQVLAEEGYILKGTQVLVVAGRGAYLIVRGVDAI